MDAALYFVGIFSEIVHNSAASIDWPQLSPTIDWQFPRPAQEKNFDDHKSRCGHPA
jgi:hypothetical protein